MFLSYINTKQKHIKVFFLPKANKYPHQIFSTPTPLTHSPHHSTHSYTVLDKGGKMHMKQSPYQLHPQQFLSSSSSFYIMLHMCILWCVSNFFAYEKKTYYEKYEWESFLLLSELSISALPSHSCLHVQKLHTTQTDRHTHTHTHIHTMYIITRMFQSF